MEYKKIDANTIERTKQDPLPEPKVDKFDYDFLIQQKKNIESQRDVYVVQRNIEIAEIDEMLAECGKLNIVAKVTEEEKEV